MVSKKKQKKQLVNKFIQIFLSTFALLMAVVGIGTVIYVVVMGNSIGGMLDLSKYNLTEYGAANAADPDGEDIFGDKKLTTFAVFGVDEDSYRTDVTMVVFFHHESGKVDIVSVPRDTKVKIPDDMYSKIKERRSDVNQVVKINGIPAYVTEDRNEASVEVLESNLGIPIDYYVNVKLDVFRYIVDTIGEIKIDIPVDMKYSDPLQDLNINLKKGEQYINGAQAEQLVRFRSGYASGDVGRVEMQQVFMKAFVEQLLNTKNRLNMVNVVGAVLVKVDTNFENAVDYLIFLDRIKPENFVMHMLPRDPSDKGGSYYIYDYDATKELLDKIINEPFLASDNIEEAVIEVSPEEIIDIKSLTISVQNGTNIKGLAGKTSNKLKEQGYDPIEAIDYEEKPVEKTKIYVPIPEAYEELKAQFKDSEMVIQPELMDQTHQIIIVLGNTEE